MATKSKHKTRTKAEKPEQEVKRYAFGKKNYRLMFIGLGLLLLGYLLMIGGGSDNPQEFSHELFSFRRITLAPILVLAGYAMEIVAIMFKAD